MRARVANGWEAFRPRVHGVSYAHSSSVNSIAIAAGPAMPMHSASVPARYMGHPSCAKPLQTRDTSMFGVPTHL